MISRIANALWLSSQKKNYRKFVRNKEQVAQVQHHILQGYLNENKNTDVGNKYNFRRIRSYSVYAKAVPIIEDYSLLSSDIDRMMKGEKDVLFQGKALFFESTSGSRGKAKYIPYNRKLKQELDTAISAWMWNIYHMYPLVFSGKFYWSLSPAVKQRDEVEASIPIGTETDTSYFNPIAALLLRQIMAVHRPKSYLDEEDFYLQSWKQLLEAQNLTFISIWSPQFLLRIIDFLRLHQSEVFKRVNCSHRRRRELIKALHQDPIQLADIFPKLQLISCWTQAQSSIWLSELRKTTHSIPIQGKGLLSTEGVVSIPWGMEDHLLSYFAHFYEFKAENNHIVLAHELQQGEEYECIITTGGGLYRYNTHDIVRCTGFIAAIPKLEFVGRSGNVSDLVGEKLSEHSLTEIFLKAKDNVNGINTLHILPYQEEKTAGYGLVVTARSKAEAKLARDFIHQELLDNPYYRQAIAAGQLQPLALCVTNEHTIEKLSQAFQRERQIKDGDLKLPLLFPLGYWKKLDNGDIQ